MLHGLEKHLRQVEHQLMQSNQIANDPLSRVLKFNTNADRDVVGFIASALAYGNVKQILKSVDTALSYLGPYPSEKLKNSDGYIWKKEIPNTFKHRFNTANDLRILYTWLGIALRESDTLENFFFNSKNNAPALPMGTAYLLENFIERMTKLPCTPYKKPKSKGVLFFFSRPSQKSSCKRLLLFLRWMAGSGPAALGHWTRLHRSQLIIPVDTHVLRISKNLGLTKRKTADWTTAAEITNQLKKINPDDPTRYDFALCHMGISKACPSKLKPSICRNCQINSLCLNYKV